MGRTTRHGLRVPRRADGSGITAARDCGTGFRWLKSALPDKSEGRGRLFELRHRRGGHGVLASPHLLAALELGRTALGFVALRTHVLQPATTTIARWLGTTGPERTSRPAAPRPPDAGVVTCQLRIGPQNGTLWRCRQPPGRKLRPNGNDFYATNEVATSCITFLCRTASSGRAQLRLSRRVTVPRRWRDLASG
jgi:hypothetical protein